MKQYRYINNLMGWFTFLIAAVVYCMTVEPTASFWDCPEFITTGYKLEVGHPPGAPFFMLTANLFSQFASDPSEVAVMVNIMSALLSAGCIMFLFWSITHLTRKLVCPDMGEMTTGKLITIMGAGLVGALAYTFTDTFWFSAVEGEVYAYSSLFTAVVFWLILKWEDCADEPHSDRWLVLIAYLTGLSIGVHLLNLLCLSALVLVYYYKKNPNATLKGSLLALVGSMVLIAVVLYGIVPGIVKVGGWFELLFVNGLGMPFNTGLIVYIILLLGVLVWSIYESYVYTRPKRANIAFLVTIALLGIPFFGHGAKSIVFGIIFLALVGACLWGVFGKRLMVSARTLNTAILCLTMMVVGYSSYAVIVIRSSANPPMDQNSPEDIFTLGDYLGREQYGQTPLFYGPAYNSKVALKIEGQYCVPVSEEGAPVYQRKEKESADEKDSYEIVRHKTDYKYAQNMLFPRMHSSAPEHIEAYEQWFGGYQNDRGEWVGGVKGKLIPYDECGNKIMVKMPTMWENLKFFFSYQVNFMYWRYFLWNFAGRQNDIQGNGEPEHGNWISGIPLLDNVLYGDQSKLPDELKENKGHNVFYCLPLILGLIGLLWQAYHGQRGIQQFWVVFFLFFMTGLAIVLYLNQTPLQPRERDYAYAGSFYAFTIWIGLGVAAIADFLQRRKLKPATAAGIATVVCLLVPIQMASQTWDDHDRSGRYVCRDFGQNYLYSIQEEGNPIIFTNGDNDTFPLWYNQETEGVRTDARVCNLSYLQTDWYIDQMKRPAYDSPSVPINWERIEFVSGKNEYITVRPEAKQAIIDMYKSNPDLARQQFGDDPFELKNVMKYWVRSKNEDLHFIPTDTVHITLDKEAIRRSGMMIPEACKDSLPDKMYIPIKKRTLYKSELMMLEMLANTNWERPLYVAMTVGSSNHMGLDPFFVQEGLAYRITPFDWRRFGYPQEPGKGYAVDSEKMYTNLMTKFKYGGIENPDVYLDENIMRMAGTHRRLFAILAGQLIKEGKTDKALKALEFCDKMIPNASVPYDFQNSSLDLARSYLSLGKEEQANVIFQAMAEKSFSYLRWYLGMSNASLSGRVQECFYHLTLIDDIVNSLNSEKNKPAYADEYAKQFQTLYTQFSQRIGA